MKKVGLVAHYGEDYFKSRVDFSIFLEEQGFSCVAFVPEDEYKEKINSLDKKVYYFSYSRSWKFVFSLYKTFLFFSEKFKEEKIDLLFTYKFFPNIVGILAARRAKVPSIVATVAGIGFLERRNDSFFIAKLFSLYMYVLDKANLVITQNTEDSNLLSEHLKKAKVIMTNGSGVNADTLVAGDVESFLKSNGLATSKRYITFCSRIVKEKGIIELIEAYKRVASTDGFPFELILAGWFDEKGIENAVMSLIQGHPKIHFVGYQKNVATLLEITEVFVLPSYYPEGVPRSLIEATAKSKVIITTDHKGCKETCVERYNGFLVKPRSVESIESVLVKLGSLDDEGMKSLKANSLKLFQSRFDRNVVYKSILDELKLV